MSDIGKCQADQSSKRSGLGMSALLLLRKDIAYRRPGRPVSDKVVLVLGTVRMNGMMHFLIWEGVPQGIYTLVLK